MNINNSSSSPPHPCYTRRFATVTIMENPMKRLSPLALLLAAPALFAQETCEAIDARLDGLLQTLGEQAVHNENTGSNDEALLAARRAISDALQQLATAHDGAWDCTFAQSMENQRFQVLTSEDRRFRAYSWDLMNGGTMRQYDSLLQYRDSNGRTHTQTLFGNTTADTVDPEMEAYLGNGAQFLQLFTADLGDKGTTYLLNSYAQASGLLKSQAIKLYRVDNDKLAPAELIQTGEGHIHDIGFAYDSGSVKQDETKLFQYDTQTNTLTFPVVIENDRFPNGEVTDKTLTYRWDGQYFVHIPLNEKK